MKLRAFWPKKRWKKILFVAFLAIMLVSVPLLIYASFGMNNDVITELVIENPEGYKTALVLYHPGLSSFSNDVSYSFSEGLVSNNWRVEIATPSIEAPTDLSKYDMSLTVEQSSGTQAVKPVVHRLPPQQSGAGNSSQDIACDLIKEMICLKLPKKSLRCTPQRSRAGAMASRSVSKGLETKPLPSITISC